MHLFQLKISIIQNILLKTVTNKSKIIDKYIVVNNCQVQGYLIDKTKNNLNKVKIYFNLNGNMILFG